MSGIHGELTCQELVEVVTDYLEGRMPAEERRRFDAHLGECDGCQAYLAQMRAAAAVAGRLREEQVSPEARGALLSAFRGWKRGG
jgi:anti-sigma factor RsiW